MDTGSTTTAGVVLLAVVAIAYGGTFVLRVVSGKQPANELQKSFFRAGHAHAGVLVVLGLVVLLLMDAAAVPALFCYAADGVLISAILMPAGFFLSVIGRNPQKPNGLIALLWAGGALLTVSLVVGGIGLLGAG
ncbi:hypothetical protein [Arthrobacter sp. JSM 101049]|uniref:hypothetical protein n=1 Tax=Arthrobacter sp. JSM 101049 TaxID=929097 RepID=UPI0035692F93